MTPGGISCYSLDRSIGTLSLIFVNLWGFGEQCILIGLCNLGSFPATDESVVAENSVR